MWIDIGGYFNWTPENVSRLPPPASPYVGESHSQSKYSNFFDQGRGQSQTLIFTPAWIYLYNYVTQYKIKLSL